MKYVTYLFNIRKNSPKTQEIKCVWRVGIVVDLKGKDSTLKAFRMPKSFFAYNKWF